MSTYTNSDLITAVLNRAQLPSSSNTANVNSDSNLLKLGTEEIYTKLLPLIMTTREEWYVASYLHTIVAGTASYSMPPRAAGRVLRDVQLISGTDIFSLPKIDPELVYTTATGNPDSFYIEDDNVVLFPTPAADYGTLRLRYYRRPNKLALPSECAQVVSISGNLVNVNSVPQTWNNNIKLDLIKKTSPFVTIGMDCAVDNVDAGAATITFSADLPNTLAVGDWIALAEYSPIPQIPQEFTPVLAQMIVVKVLEAYGDREGAGAAAADLKDIEANAIRMITPRVHGERKKVIGRNW